MRKSEIERGKAGLEKYYAPKKGPKEYNIYSMIYHCTKAVFPFSISSFKTNIRGALKDIKL